MVVVAFRGGYRIRQRRRQGTALEKMACASCVSTKLYLTSINVAETDPMVVVTFHWCRNYFGTEHPAPAMEMMTGAF